ncbi:hypothetical protein ALI144C_38755 [Actinosynnema sp. ALI-1.44]|uniref:hypothetical protein n=1 Tax=Actinosynnema sp. ALI-1.44 TaxID=1933779 RepID=UPI00097C4183|nr:hypothetical protein [Actinosynnema sp. ALI-1.44]ONI74751.1 hypothetical protein ALI144C_38755 [Actinosynnema sp. ALI-1.44]
MPGITDHEQLIAEVVAAQAPRVFATVVTTDVSDGVTTDDSEVNVLGWGMQFTDNSAYMVSADGRNQYFLAEAENALMYIRTGPDAVADLVWLDGEQEEAGQDAI